MSDLTESRPEGRRTYSRRSVTRAAAWSVPAVAVVSAAPAFAASTTTDIGAYTVNGTCGALGLGLLSTGFDVTAGSAPIPVGSSMTLTGSGLVNLGVLTYTGPVSLNITGTGASRTIVLTTALPAGQTLALRTTLNVSIAWSVSAVTSLPTGYTASGAKTAGDVSGTLVLCSDN